VFAEVLKQTAWQDDDVVSFRGSRLCGFRLLSLELNAGIGDGVRDPDAAVLGSENIPKGRGRWDAF
jgi:hypothetical protein